MGTPMPLIHTILAIAVLDRPPEPQEGVDWHKAQIVVTGRGVASEGARGRLMGERAATVDGYRRLAEVVAGVNVDGTTTVQDFVTASDGVRTQIQAIIRGARVMAIRSLNDGTQEAVLSLSLTGLGQALPIQAGNLGTAEVRGGNAVPSLILDARGTSFTPCLMPHIETGDRNVTKFAWQDVRYVAQAPEVRETDLFIRTRPNGTEGTDTGLKVTPIDGQRLNQWLHGLGSNPSVALVVILEEKRR